MTSTVTRHSSRDGVGMELLQHAGVFTENGGCKVAAYGSCRPAEHTMQGAASLSLVADTCLQENR
jgi:hypothetical protein